MEKVHFAGRALDLGGLIGADYHRYLAACEKVEIANNYDSADENYHKIDIESIFPLNDNQYDYIVCLNVLEHIFNFQNTVNESFRILKPGGRMVATTPFLYQYHPCPDDYWRFTKPGLKKIFAKAGFKEVEIKEVGTGVFSATAQLKSGLYKFDLIRKFFYSLNLFLDKFLRLHEKGRSLREENYPIGFFIIAGK